MELCGEPARRPDRSALCRICANSLKTGIAPWMIALSRRRSMVMKPEPLFEAVEPCWEAYRRSNGRSRAGIQYAIVLLSAAGKRFTQGTARSYAALKRIIFICGRYEGWTSA